MSRSWPSMARRSGQSPAHHGGRRTNTCRTNSNARNDLSTPCAKPIKPITGCCRIRTPLSASIGALREEPAVEARSHTGEALRPAAGDQAEPPSGYIPRGGDVTEAPAAGPHHPARVVPRPSRPERRTAPWLANGARLVARRGGWVRDRLFLPAAPGHADGPPRRDVATGAYR